MVSDLTYVWVNSKWNYICLFVDIFNRQIVGYSVGRKKSVELVYRALAGIKVNLKKIKMFHSDKEVILIITLLMKPLVPLEYHGL